MNRPTPKHKDPYWNGVLCGAFLGCFLMSIASFLFIQYQGLQFAINPEQLAQMVRTKIQNQAKQDIPQLLEKIKIELPNELPNHLEELDNLTINIGNSQVKLPPELSAALKEEFSRTFEVALINTLNNYNLMASEELIGKNTYELIRKAVKQEIIGRTYHINYSHWFSVPVKIVETSQRNTPFEIGI
ncbi:MAG TPA: hypothetical protein DDW50_19045 [Firmicutes bacterium]|jgi:hypothetical protein|nr:hypothetical protein [Bacillota bacterium]